jgi:hypothetical protein
MTHVTKEFHRVPPILFLSVRYVDTNRAPILHQELHYLQTDRTELPLEPHHLGAYRVLQNDFYAYGMFGANHAPILH